MTIDTTRHRDMQVLLTNVWSEVRHAMRDAGILQEGMVHPDVEEAMKHAAHAPGRAL